MELNHNDKKKEIISFGRLLYQKGLVTGTDGNISVRTSRNTVLITASGVHKGFIKTEQIIEIDMKCSVVAGDLKPSSESFLHIETYNNIPSCMAIIHAHAPWSIAASLEEDTIDLSIMAEGRLLFGKVEVVPLASPGTKKLAQLSSAAATRSQIHILKAHGVVAWGKDLMEAYCLVEALEQNIKILGIRKAFFTN